MPANLTPPTQNSSFVRPRVNACEIVESLRLRSAINKSCVFLRRFFTTDEHGLTQIRQEEVFLPSVFIGVHPWLKFLSLVAAPPRWAFALKTYCINHCRSGPIGPVSATRPG